MNVEETSIRRDAPPEKMIENKGEETLRTVISISLTGKRLGQMIILKDKGVKKLKSTVPHDVTISYNQKSSWMNSAIMLEWVNFVLAPYAKKLPADKFGLLLMDNHSTKEMKHFLRGRLIPLNKFHPATPT